jgi:hypothetical protein
MLRIPRKPLIRQWLAKAALPIEPGVKQVVTPAKAGVQLLDLTGFRRAPE